MSFVIFVTRIPLLAIINSVHNYCVQNVLMHITNDSSYISTHEIINIHDGTVNTSKLLPFNEVRNMKCNDHNEPIKVYCETCEELIC